ncbi:MAG TPA: hypothetical protein VF153_06185 [Candidatus Limnocylindria bacterium]
MQRATELERLILERFSPVDAPADTALGLAQRFEVDEDTVLAALAPLVDAGLLESLVVGRLVVFCRTGRRPLLLDRWFVSEPTLWRRSHTTHTPAPRALDDGFEPPNSTTGNS